MTDVPYPPDTLDESCDDGTMPDNVQELAYQVVGLPIESDHA